MENIFYFYNKLFSAKNKIAVEHLNRIILVKYMSFVFLIYIVSY